MGIQTWQETLVIAPADGPTLTAAAAASCIHTGSRIILPNNFFYVGKKLQIVAHGRISCAVTTPGTARFDVRMGPSGTIIVFDSGALNLNIVAKTTVPWKLEILMTCRAVGSGTASNFMSVGEFQSEAVVGSPLPAVGGNGSLLCPVGAPVVGTGFDNTAANAVDMFFTQTVATGSMTVHGYRVDALN